MNDSISEVENSVNDVTSLLEEKGKVSEETILMDSRLTARSKVSYEERFALLALKKAEDQKSDELQDQCLDNYQKRN